MICKIDEHTFHYLVILHNLDIHKSRISWYRNVQPIYSMGHCAPVEFDVGEPTYEVEVPDVTA